MSDINTVREESLKKAREALKEKRLISKKQDVNLNDTSTLKPEEKLSKKRKREENVEDADINIDTSTVLAVPVPFSPIIERRKDLANEGNQEGEENENNLDEDLELFSNENETKNESNNSMFQNVDSKIGEFRKEFPNYLKSCAKSGISSLCWSFGLAGILVVRYMVQSRIQDKIAEYARSCEGNIECSSNNQNDNISDLQLKEKSQDMMLNDSVNINDYLR